MKKSLVIVSGPSGIGKSRVVSATINKTPLATRLITTTSREPRAGEIQGRDYHFLNKEKFERGIENDDYLEFVDNYGHYYGSSVRQLEQAWTSHPVVFLILDTRGALSVKKKFPDSISIFIMPNSISELRQMLVNRGDSEEHIQKRLEAVPGKIAQADWFDYRITNTYGQLNRTVSDVLSIVLYKSIVVGIDFDEVIIDHSQAKLRAARNLGIALDISETPSDIMRQKLTPDQLKRIKQCFYNRSDYLSAPLFPGVKDGLQFLIDRGISYFLISRQRDPGLGLEKMRQEKLWGDYFSEKNVTFVPDNSNEAKAEEAKKLGIDIFLDDQPSALRYMVEFVKTRFLFDQLNVYPANNENYIKVTSWQDFIHRLNVDIECLIL